MILARSRPNSFCYALSQRVVTTLRSARHDLVIHDLYEEYFDAILKVHEAYTVGDTTEEAISRSSGPVINRYC